MESERVLVHRALEAMFERFYRLFDGARFERRSDLIVALLPSFPIPQCNGPWVVQDSQAAVEALPAAVAEVEAAGAWPWVQTRSGHDRTRQAAIELGFTHVERVPGMVIGRDELAAPDHEVEIALVDVADIDETNEILAVCFGAPKELFDRFCGALRRLEEISWYLARTDAAIVSTGLGFTLDGATGIFNVATPPEHRGHGYGAAVTARAVGDGFAAGSRFAFLQSTEMGHGVYRKLGFREVEEYVLLSRPLPAVEAGSEPGSPAW